MNLARIRRDIAALVRKYILPAFGHLTVDAITVEHVKDWFASMADRPGSANRAIPVLSVMMRMAELWGYRPHNSNPLSPSSQRNDQGAGAATGSGKGPGDVLR